MLDILRPWFSGDFARYGEAIRLTESSRALPTIAEQLHDPAFLEAALASHARSLNDARDLRAVCSDWTLRYFAALWPAAIAFASALERGIPFSWREMTITLDPNGAPAEFSIKCMGAPMPGASPAARYEALLWDHLMPLIKAIRRQVPVAEKILWGNAHRSITSVFEHAARQLGPTSSLRPRLDGDRRQLLDSSVWPDGRRNPLFFRQRHIVVQSHDSPRRMMLHASCCLAFRLPTTGYCSACPLSPNLRRGDTNNTLRGDPAFANFGD